MAAASLQSLRSMFRSFLDPYTLTAGLFPKLNHFICHLLLCFPLIRYLVLESDPSPPGVFLHLPCLHAVYSQHRHSRAPGLLCPTPTQSMYSLPPTWISATSPSQPVPVPTMSLPTVVYFTHLPSTLSPTVPPSRALCPTLSAPHMPLHSAPSVLLSVPHSIPSYLPAHLTPSTVPCQAPWTLVSQCSRAVLLCADLRAFVFAVFSSHRYPPGPFLNLSLSSAPYSSPQGLL